jgi:hypothetical protein
MAWEWMPVQIVDNARYERRFYSVSVPERLIVLVIAGFSLVVDAVKW